jgi:hypothetical protein
MRESPGSRILPVGSLEVSVSKLVGSLRLSIGIAGLLLAVASFPASGETPHSFVGSQQCRGCHMTEFQSWSATRMAKAFELLRPGSATASKTRAQLDPFKDYTADARCLACHTTGYGKPGGFVDLKTTPDLAGVGCETCHGAGGGYVHTMKDRGAKKAAFVAAGMVGDVSARDCIDCHNSKTAAGTVIGSRHFVKQFVFGKTKGIHELAATKKD